MGDYLNDPHLENPYLNQEASMTDRSKIIFVNTDGDYEETSAADSLKFASFKTANYELTDSLLGDVVNKMIKSDGSRDFAANQSMGGFKLTNLADGVADSDAINYGQLLDAINGMDWKDSVRAATTAALPAVTYANGTSGVGATLTADVDGALAAQDGVSLIVGDRLLVKNQVAALQNGIYEVTDLGDGSSPFILTRAIDADEAASEVTANMTVSVEEGTTLDGRVYQLSTNNAIVMGTTALTFVKLPFNSLTGGAGITIAGEVFAADLLTGGGIKFVGAGDAGQLAVEPSEFAGDGLVDDGSDNLAIDWATDFTIDAADDKAVKASDLANTGNGLGASIIGSEDAGGYFTADDVEGQLQEIGAAQGGKIYDVETAGVAKGDLVYSSANNEVAIMPISAMHRGLSLAKASVAGGGTVGLSKDGDVLTGVLTGATAGTRYYWSGTALTTTIPSGSGSYVWQVGSAVNATDLYVHVEFVKKNS